MIAGLGAMIVEARTRAGLSQAGLADALAVQPSSVRRWERGQATPTLPLFRQMVAILGPWPLLTAVLPAANPADPADPDVDGGRPAGWPDREELARQLGRDHPDPAAGGLDDARPLAVMEGLRGDRPSKGRQSACPPREELARLLAEGHTDQGIGERYGRSAKTVAAWRGTLNLPRQPPRQLLKPPREELARLVAEGLSDLQISRRYRVAQITVRLWRYDYGGLLRRDRPSPRPSRQRLAGLVSHGLSDLEISRRYQVTAATVAVWRRNDGLRRPRRLVDPTQVREVQALRALGWTATMIAVELGCSPSRVYNLARRPPATATT